MRKLIAIALLMLPLMSKAQVAAGVKSGPKGAFLLHDFSMFDIDSEDNFNLRRYGFGRGQLEITDRLGMSADNRSGILLRDDNKLNFGVEVAAGQVGYHDRPEYQWQPGLSMGYKECQGPVSFYIGPRAGYSYENNLNTSYIGAVATIEIYNYGATYWVNNYPGEKAALQVYDINLYNKINIQKRYENGQEYWYLGYKFVTR